MRELYSDVKTWYKAQWLKYLVCYKKIKSEINATKWYFINIPMCEIEFNILYMWHFKTLRKEGSASKRCWENWLSILVDIDHTTQN